MGIKREYTKRDCSYWGHDNKVIGKGSLNGAGVTLLQCKRCDARTWSKGVTNTELKDLISMTLKDMPIPLLTYNPMIRTSQHSLYRKWWNLWLFWRQK